MTRTIKFLLLGLVVFSLIHCAPKVGDQVSAPKASSEVPDAPKSESLRTHAPAPGPARKIEIGDYDSFVLPNGLTVIVVENHKIPRISYQLFVDRDPVLEGDKSGLTGLAGQMMSRGTTSRTKSQIDESIDFVGASLSTGPVGGFASSLTRHNETVLSIFADVMLNPSFPEEEFEKVKKQTLSGLQTEKDDPGSISANVSGVLVYGKTHPYGEVTTETTVSNLTVEDCRQYYETYFKPNISYLVVVGDIKPSVAKSQAEKYFGNWKREAVKEMTFPQPSAPARTEVAFVDKAGAVQSLINITYPVDLKPGSPDIIPARVMNTILGSGFSGRLFKNLREDKAYTYGAYSSLDSDEEVGEFSANASVRNEVTDSAVTQFLIELNGLRDSDVSDDELELAKNYIAGAFARSLESPQTVASFALNTFQYKLPREYYATYLERLDKVSKADVRAMAMKYLQPDHAHIVVVGNQDAVSEKLAQFDQEDGKVTFYDIYGNKKAAPASAGDVSGTEVIQAYLKAIGGADKLHQVTSLIVESAMPVEGMGEMTVVEKRLAPDSYVMTMSMAGQTVMKQVFDGEVAFVEQMGQKQMIEGEQLEKMKAEARLFPELAYLEEGYTVEVKGLEEIDGQQAYKVLVTGPAGSTTEYYAKESGLKLREIDSQEMNGQVMSVINDYGDYRAINGIQFPYLVKITGMFPVPLEVKATKVEVNVPIDAGVFE